MTGRLLRIVLLAVAATLAPTVTWATTKTLKLGDVQPPDLIVQKGLARFAELVKERTGGAVEVQIFPGSQLGTEQEMIEGVKLGTIDMFQGSTGSVGRFLPELEAFAHPYIWRDTEHLLKVVRGEIGQELTQKLLGYRPFGFVRK